MAILLGHTVTWVLLWAYPLNLAHTRTQTHTSSSASPVLCNWMCLLLFSLLKTEQLVNAFVFGCFATHCPLFSLAFFPLLPTLCSLPSNRSKDRENVTSPQLPPLDYFSCIEFTSTAFVSCVGQLCVLCDAVLYCFYWCSVSLCCVLFSLMLFL